MTQPTTKGRERTVSVSTFNFLFDAGVQAPEGSSTVWRADIGQALRQPDPAREKELKAKQLRARIKTIGLVVLATTSAGVIGYSGTSILLRNSTAEFPSVAQERNPGLVIPVPDSSEVGRFPETPGLTNAPGIGNLATKHSTTPPLSFTSTKPESFQTSQAPSITITGIPPSAVSTYSSRPVRKTPDPIRTTPDAQPTTRYASPTASETHTPRPSASSEPSITETATPSQSNEPISPPATITPAASPSQ